jgi:four helix bundle protein
MPERIRTHLDLEVYRRSFDAAMVIYEASKSFPREEAYSLTDQCRRASRSVCANIAEAWRKRRYPASFVSKLSDAETEAAEMQVWISFAVRCGYMDRTAWSGAVPGI